MAPRNAPRLTAKSQNNAPCSRMDFDRHTKGSDVDVAVGLEAGASLEAQYVSGLIVDLEAAAGRSVDLVIVNEAPCSLTYRVFKDGRTLFQRNRSRFLEHKQQSILEYLDSAWVESVFAEAVLRRARETA
ncbi:MAG: nucleotidyltransferase domain-containing protein [Myxococcota bacterium]